MDLYDWLLSLHVLSAALVIGPLTALWGLIVGTRGTAPLLDADTARRYGRVAGPLVGAGMAGAIVFGVWLAIHVDGYELWDGWILASLLLWALAGFTGVRSGQEFERDPVGRRVAGIRHQTVSSLAVLLILVLMIWKPGA